MGRTGPRTSEGKAVARMNAIRHGIYSYSPVIAGLEADEDWDLHLRSLIEAFAPDGSLELMFAERVAALSWRLLRVMRYERDTITTRQEQVDDDVPVLLDRERSRLLAAAPRADRFLAELGIDHAAAAASIRAMFPTTSFDEKIDRREQQTDFLRRERLLPDEATLNKIMRYEAHLSRQFYQALHELEALQTRRKGGAAPLARLDLHGPAST